MKLTLINQLTQRILTTGTLLSVILVLIGGIIYLYHNGGQPIQPELVLSSRYEITILQFFSQPFTSITLINLGILILIFTQIFRVGMLVIYYFIEKDIWFTLISLFVLGVLLYSLIFRHA